MKAVLFAVLLIGLTSATPLSNYFYLSFYWAARELTPGSTIAAQLPLSIANVIWNNQIIFSIIPGDFSVNYNSLTVTATPGSNLLQFEGAGDQSTYNAGLSITNITLIRSGDTTHTNILVNGNFAQQSYYGWVSMSAIQIGPGRSYNSAWGPNDIIAQLSSDRNYLLKQKFTFDSSYNLITNFVNLPRASPLPSTALGGYFLRFQWAPSTFGPLSSSTANVIWNGLVLGTLIPQNYNINTAIYTISFLSSINNTLQFDGTSLPDNCGVTIGNVKIIDQATFKHSPLSFTNGLFTTPYAGAGLSFQVSSVNNGIRPLPGWSVFRGVIGDATLYNPKWAGVATQVIALDAGMSNIRYTAYIPVLASNKGYDLVGPLTRSAFAQLLNKDGTNQDSFVYVRADSNQAGVANPNAPLTLANAQGAGLSTSIYIKLCRNADPTGQIISILSQIDSIYYSIVWLKVEPNLAAGCSWNGYTPVQNLAFLQAALTLLVQNGITPGIFSTPIIWKLYFGTTADSLGQSGALLWYADYKNGHVDSTNSFADYKTFAGFSTPTLKQTAGNQTVILSKYHAFVDFAYTESWQISP